MKTLKEKKILVGKVDGYNIGVKNCPVYADVEIRNQNKGIVFAASIGVYNHIKTDMFIAGQAFDTVTEDYPYLLENEKLVEIINLWRKYHLNDMHAGTIEQEEAIHNAIDTGVLKDYDYTKVVEYLKSINLYEVEYEGKPYKYGTGWLYRPIPSEDIKRIYALFD
jgi:hypothetical protein